MLYVDMAVPVEYEAYTKAKLSLIDEQDNHFHLYIWVFVLGPSAGIGLQIYPTKHRMMNVIRNEYLRDRRKKKGGSENECYDDLTTKLVFLFVLFAYYSMKLLSKKCLFTFSPTLNLIITIRNI